MKRFVFILVFCLLFVPQAFAMPGSDRFSEADTDKDGYLSPEEFASAFPALKLEAFSLIDKNSDSRIDREEWRAFRTGHGMGAPAPITPAPATPAAPADQGTAPAPGAGEDKAPDSGSLPLLAPPAR